MFLEIPQNSQENTCARVSSKLLERNKYNRPDEFEMKIKILYEKQLELQTTHAILDRSYYDQKQPPEVFFLKSVLRNSAKFAGKHLCQSLFFNKVTLLKKRLWRKCFL